LIGRACAGFSVLLSATIFAGCYGSTEKATDVGFTGATLNGKGTSNNGPAQSFFEYWPTASPASKSTTAPRNWPGEVSGPFDKKIDGLEEGTKYSFRMCGNDQDQPPVCAQTRTFETDGHDASSGHGTHNNSGTTTGSFSAESDAGGRNPSGLMGLVHTPTLGAPVSSFQGQIVCLQVTGNVARVAATGKSFVGSTPGPVVTIYAKVIAGSSGQGTFDYQSGTLEPTANSNCASYDGGGQVLSGDFAVTDSQPPEPPS
jgi:hypothetical protein